MYPFVVYRIKPIKRRSSGIIVETYKYEALCVLDSENDLISFAKSIGITAKIKYWQFYNILKWYEFRDLYERRYKFSNYLYEFLILSDYLKDSKSHKIRKNNGSKKRNRRFIMSCYKQNFTTFQNIKNDVYHEQDSADVKHEFGINIKFRKRWLPDVKDDIMQNYHSNWKEYRKTQYKN